MASSSSSAAQSLFTVLVHEVTGQISMTPTYGPSSPEDAGKLVNTVWRCIATDMSEEEARRYVRTFWRDMTSADEARRMREVYAHSRYAKMPAEEFAELFQRPSIEVFRSSYGRSSSEMHVRHEHHERHARQSRDAAYAWNSLYPGSCNPDSDSDEEVGDCPGGAEGWAELVLGFEQAPPSPTHSSSDGGAQSEGEVAMAATPSSSLPAGCEGAPPEAQQDGNMAGEQAPRRMRGQKSIKRPRGVRRAEARLRAKATQGQAAMPRDGELSMSGGCSSTGATGGNEHVCEAPPMPHRASTEPLSGHYRSAAATSSTAAAYLCPTAPAFIPRTATDAGAFKPQPWMGV
jgi:hypothetical protein